MAEPSRGDSVLTVPFPAPRSGGWLLMLVIGLGLAGFGASVLWKGGLSAFESESLHLPLVAIGAGLVLAFFAVLILAGRDQALEVVGNPVDGMIRIRMSGGASISIPACSFSTARTHPSQSSGCATVALLKKDGGVLELGVLGDELAEQAVATLRELIESAPEAKSAGLFSLREVGGVTVTETADAIAASWSASNAVRMLGALGPCVGMWMIVWAFHRYEPGLGTLIGMAFAGTMAAAVLIFTLINVGVVQRVTVDAEALTLERVRFGKAIKTQRVELNQIEAVDYTHQLSTVGAGLTIRTARAARAHASATGSLSAAAENEDPARALIGLAQLLRSGIVVPCGTLSFAAKVALDHALGEEISRRTAKSAARL